MFLLMFLAAIKNKIVSFRWYLRKKAVVGFTDFINCKTLVCVYVWTEQWAAAAAVSVTQQRAGGKTNTTHDTMKQIDNGWDIFTFYCCCHCQINTLGDLTSKLYIITRRWGTEIYKRFCGRGKVRSGKTWFTEQIIHPSLAWSRNKSSLQKVRQIFVNRFDDTGY